MYVRVLNQSWIRGVFRNLFERKLLAGLDFSVQSYSGRVVVI